MGLKAKKPSKNTPKKDGDSVQILGVKVNSTSTSSVLRKISQRIDGGEKTFVVTPNPEFLVYAQKHFWFKLILNKADIAIPDGIGLVWASRFLVLWSPTEILLSASDSLAKRCPLLKKLIGARKVKPHKIWWASHTGQEKVTSRPSVIKEKISGADLMEKLCALAAKKGWSVYLLGGAPGVALKSLTALKNRYPGLNGWVETGPKLETGNWKLETAEKWVEKINEKKPTFLFIAFGMGKQEKFIYDNWDKLNVKLAMGVGGAFDYLSGQIPRAPKWIQKLGFEWLYRLIRQPRRWRRQLSLLEFIWLVIKEKFSS